MIEKFTAMYLPGISGKDFSNKPVSVNNIRADGILVRQLSRNGTKAPNYFFT